MSVVGTAVPTALGAALFFASQEGTPAGDKLGNAGLILFGSGLLLGPSLGHFYARESVRRLSTAGLRAVLAGFTILALIAASYSD
jgi:hypothetical protein